MSKRRQRPTCICQSRCFNPTKKHRGLLMTFGQDIPTLFFPPASVPIKTSAIGSSAKVETITSTSEGEAGNKIDVLQFLKLAASGLDIMASKTLSTFVGLIGLSRGVSMKVSIRFPPSVCQCGDSSARSAANHLWLIHM